MDILVGRKNENELYIRFKYNPNYVEKIKRIEGRKWDAEGIQWLIPSNDATLNQLKSQFSEKNIIFHESLYPAKNTVTLQHEWQKAIIKEMYNKIVLHGYSNKTRKSYLGHMSRFFHHLYKHVDEITTDDINTYLLYLLETKKASHSYVEQAISSIKFLYKEVLNRDEIIINIPRPKKERKLPEVLSQAETMRILENIENLKHRSILLLVYSAGLRVGEVVRLKINDIDSQRMLIHIVQAKGRKDRYTLLSGVALKELRIYVKEYRPSYWLFEGEKPSEHLTERTVQRVFEKAKAKAGVKKRVTVHSLRHSFATHLLESGVDIRYIQELLGHESSRTTEIYTHVTEKGLKGIVSPLDKMVIKCDEDTK